MIEGLYGYSLTIDFLDAGGASAKAVPVLSYFASFFYLLRDAFEVEVAEFSGFFGTANGFNGSTSCCYF